ncbi:MAG: hypothetical protein AAF411_02840 [Myxococcota bacterium]
MGPGLRRLRWLPMLLLSATANACGSTQTPIPANIEPSPDALGCDSVEELLRSVPSTVTGRDRRELALEVRLIREAGLNTSDEDITAAIKGVQDENNISDEEFWSLAAERGYDVASYRAEVAWYLKALPLESVLVEGYGGAGTHKDRLTQVLARFDRVETSHSDDGTCVEHWPRLRVGEVSFEGDIPNASEIRFANADTNGVREVGALGAPSLSAAARNVVARRGFYYPTILMDFTEGAINVRVKPSIRLSLASVEVDDSQCDVRALFGSEADIVRGFPIRVGEPMDERARPWARSIIERLEASSLECAFSSSVSVRPNGAYVRLRFTAQRRN